MMDQVQQDSTSGGAHDDVGVAVAALYGLTHHLRRECPWDQAQTAATIVPHTLEEAYEVADCVMNGAPVSELEDELGDLLFQVSFLAMWCEEHDPSITLGTVARRIHDKLVRRHPHVFGDVAADTADDVRGAWESVKRGVERRGLFDGIPGAMPAVGQARKLQERASSVGFDFNDVDAALDKVDDEMHELREAIVLARAAGVMPTGEQAPPDPHVQAELGDVLMTVVNVARLARVDPELALRASNDKFRVRVERAIEMATDANVTFSELSLDQQETWYQLAKREIEAGARQ